MQHVTLTPFGQRSVTYADLATHDPCDPAPGPVDKWALLARLRVARAAFGVTDRDLTVLAALLSCLPARQVQVGAALIVHPSNATLSDRAHGMAESTLRRHLAALVQAGLIGRHDSPNGKRFVARGAGGPVAFGLDLTPLARQADRIAAQAGAAEADALVLHRRREALVLRLRDTAKLAAFAAEQRRGIDLVAVEAGLSLVRSGLRRRMTGDGLGALEALLAPIHAQTLAVLAVPAEEPHVNAAHSGRHHHNSTADDSDLEPRQETGAGDAVAPEAEASNGFDGFEAQRSAWQGPAMTLPMALVLKACPDILDYCPAPPRHWQDLQNAAEAVRPHMGISPDAWAEALRVLGPVNAAISLAGILQRFRTIRSAGGYLRALTRRAADGAYAPGPMIMSLLVTAGRQS